MSIILESFLITWAVMRMCSIAPTHILSLILYAIFSYTIFTIKQNTAFSEADSKTKKTVRTLSAVFVLLYTAGGMEQLWNGLDNVVFRLFILLISIAGMYTLFYRILQLLFYFSEKVEITQKEMFSKKLPIYSFFICIVAWIPYFFKNFPGIMTIDSMNQYAQIIGVYSENNHHPWVHTKIIELFYHIGMLITKNPTIAISFYTFFQMLFMGGCVMYLVWVMRTEHVKKGIMLAVVMFYAFIPYNGIYAVTIWKDPMFAGSVLLFVTSTFYLLRHIKREATLKETAGTIAIFVISGIGMSLLRTNGYYAFLVSIPFFILGVPKLWRRNMLFIQLAILAVVVCIKGPVMEARGVIQPDLVESLSIPAQQISKIIVEGKELTEEQSNFLNQILDVSKIPELYNPYVSDGFKRLVRGGHPQYLEENFGQFLKIYIQLGIKYPKEYLVAFRDQSIGYWFPTQEGLIAADEGVIPNEFGIQNMPLLKGKAIVKINEILLKLKDMIPGYGILWSAGAMTWLMLLAFSVVYVKREKNRLLCFLPNIAILLTLIAATPVAKDFRYAYALIYCIPFYIVLSFLKTVDK